MAEKHRARVDDAQLRANIQAPELLELLGNHAFGLVDLSQSKIKAIEILLKKCLPDITAVQVDVSGGVQIEVLQVKSHPVKKAPAKKAARSDKAAK